jgi:hypothetical protein
MTFAQRRNRLMTHFSKRILVVERRVTEYRKQEENQNTLTEMLNTMCIGVRIFSISQCSLHAYSSSPYAWFYGLVFNVRWWKEIVKLLAMQFLRVISFIICLKSKYLPRLCYLASCTLVCFHRARDQVL